ncbi:MAG: hypothetical protein LQ340_006200 [Diploschistes diacapsis]|nr:MAG: hypothetical protein LQ340_006200 [Diploschistes diacapsis]
MSYIVSDPRPADSQRSVRSHRSLGSLRSRASSTPDPPPVPFLSRPSGSILRREKQSADHSSAGSVRSANTAPISGPVPSGRDATLIAAATEYSKKYMSQSHFDCSHDFAHVERVVRHAKHILEVEQRLDPWTPYDPTVVTLAALFHDLNDRKYLTRTVMFASDIEDPETQVKRVLLQLGASQALARKVQIIVKNVSYTNETLDPAHNRGVVLQHPELAIVQDADRLDAIGAIGIGRVFAYGATKAPSRGLQGSVDHFSVKLERLEGMMKTAEGKRLANIRTKRLKAFRGWWEEEMHGEYQLPLAF